MKTVIDALKVQLKNMIDAQTQLTASCMSKKQELSMLEEQETKIILEIRALQTAVKILTEKETKSVKSKTTR